MPKKWSMFFTALAIQNAYFCIQLHMFVTLDSNYISLQCLIYLWFNQQHFRYLSIFYTEWCSSEWVLDWKGCYHGLNWGTILIYRFRKIFWKDFEFKFIYHVSVTAKMEALQELQFSPAVSDGFCYWMYSTYSGIFLLCICKFCKQIFILLFVILK